MSRRAQDDNISFEFRLSDITIPGNGGNGTGITALVEAALGSTPTYFTRMISWEIVENAAAFHAALTADMVAPFLVKATNVGLNLAVSKDAMDKTFVRSTTASTVAAKVIMYLTDENVIWTNPVD